MHLIIERALRYPRVPLIRNSIFAQNDPFSHLWSHIVRNISGQQFAIMVDETTDIANTEQMVFCLRYVDDQLNSHEEFIGMHSLDSTTAQSITHTIEDILLRLSLRLSIVTASAMMEQVLWLAVE